MLDIDWEDYRESHDRSELNVLKAYFDHNGNNSTAIDYIQDIQRNCTLASRQLATVVLANALRM